MVLRYKLEYSSNDYGYAKILDNILKKKDTNYKIKKDDEYITLFVEDEEKSLLKISDELSKELPLSIFLKDFALEVVPQIPPENYHNTLDSCQKSYCSNCLAEIKKKELTSYYNPFISCQICGTTSNAKSLDIHENNHLLNFKTFKESFEYLAKKIYENKIVKIKNSQMQFTLKRFKEIEKEQQSLLCTNIDSLSTLVVGSKQKDIALLSLEKPTIKFNINTIYKNNHKVDFETVDITYPWDLVLYLLSKELHILGVNFLVVEEDSKADIEVNYENSITPPKISFCEDRIFLLENSCYDKRLDEVYNKFEEPSKSQFLVLLDENRLYEKSILNIFISSKYNDAVTFYNPEIGGFVDILDYNLPKNISSIFHDISKMENGKTLLENYQNKFPELYEQALNSDISDLKTKSILNLWKIAEIVLGIDNIYKKASHSLLQKGPRIDYKLKQSNKNFNKEFDFISFIKSGMSFKLAGVDEKTLSLGYVENFFYMLSDLVDSVNEEQKLDGISLCGDMIADDFTNKLINKTFTKSLKLYYNKDFPIQL
ncbi:hypothetical protein [Halarcobacter ebronensis]|uniref:Hydrogenase n=1 Tax=Halarcobacter ebronensis TaxID=1462615 RepID=A0A4Q1AUV5_9BACT|nr:hypothetical protein [Halarcobacter ebronensis]QKF81639.1 hypothetical protein AEBR_1144 [Halarcobacter ebronensis]RXK05563.1 hypothetical protein CRV07_08630 [Halarcobacter ebronensis]